MIFKTHAYNIPQIRAVIVQHGECWFHGDGQCYSKEGDSRNHRDFVNPKQEEAKYRMVFRSVSQLPEFINGETKEQTEELNKEAVEQLNEMLMKAKNVEIRTERQATQTKGVDIMEMSDDMQPKGKAAPAAEVAGPSLAELKAQQDQESQEQKNKADEAFRQQQKEHKANMEAFNSKMDTLDQRLKDLDARSKELDKKAAELDKKSTALNKKAEKSEPGETQA